MTKILITGATGNIGSRVTRSLLNHGFQLRLYVRDLEKAKNLFGNTPELAKGDLHDAHALKRAIEGTDKIFLLTTGSRIAEIDALVASLAESAKVKHIIKLSSLDRRTTETDTIGAQHQRGESSVRRSGVPFTIVQSTALMSNVFAWAASIKYQGVVRASTGDGKIAMIHPDDLADVLVQTIITDDFKNQTIEATGPELLSYSEMTSQVSQIIHKDVAFESIDDERAYTQLIKAGVDPVLGHSLVNVWRSVREGHTAILSNDVARVLQRKSRTFTEFLTENRHVFD